MGFGGKNRKARGSRGRPRARKRKGETRAQRRRRMRVWSPSAWRVLKRADRAVVDGFAAGVHPNGFDRFAAIAKATEAAINKLLVDKATELGLDALFAPTVAYDRMFGHGQDCARGLATGIVTRCSCTIVTLGDRYGVPDVLACTLPDGHADWHLDEIGARWRFDGGNLIVQPKAVPESVTIELGSPTPHSVP